MLTFTDELDRSLNFLLLMMITSFLISIILSNGQRGFGCFLQELPFFTRAYVQPEQGVDLADHGMSPAR